MNDRPAARELIAAARHFLETELIQSLSDPRLKFQTLITANVLAIAERELETEPAHLEIEFAELNQQLGAVEPARENLDAMRQAVAAANVRLCVQIRRGDYDDPKVFLSLIKLVRASVERKLVVANPRYLAGSSNA